MTAEFIMENHPAIFFLGFLALWAAIFLLVARLGGWTLLAKVYRASEAYSGKSWWFRSASVRWRMNYNNCLILGANARGLYISILLPFRIGHPPLFIPWRDVSVEEKKYWSIRYYEFIFRRSPEVPFRISKGLGDKIAAQAGHWWPGATSG